MSSVRVPAFLTEAAAGYGIHRSRIAISLHSQVPVVLLSMGNRRIFLRQARAFPLWRGEILGASADLVAEFQGIFRPPAARCNRVWIMIMNW